MEKKDRRDGRIELLRFLFCLLIMMHHSYLIGLDESRPFASAYVFVEFFFFISGYYLCRHYIGGDDNKDGTDDKNGLRPIKYALSKWKGLLFYSVSNVLLMNGLLCITESRSMLSTLNMLAKEIPEALFLSMCGLDQQLLIPSFWYVSAYLLVLSLFIYIIQNHKRLFSACGVLYALLYYGYTRLQWGSTVQWHNYLGFCYDGLLRALAGLSVVVSSFMRKLVCRL